MWIVQRYIIFIKALITDSHHNTYINIIVDKLVQHYTDS